jgi:U2-associated protein SR140
MERAHTDEPLSFLLSPPSSSPHTPSTLSPEHLYYRWRVYSLAQGETLTQYRQRPFQMVPTGAFWIPPDVNVLLREQEAKRKRRREAQEKEDEEKRKASKNSRSDAPGGKDRSSTRGKLSEHSAHTLMSLLRSVTMDRLAVRDVMGFCLDHSDASAEVVELLVDSLCLDETPLPKKIARFYVVSDILHNCTAPVPNASSYRSHFQSSLHRVFAALHRLHSSPALGRLSANALKEKVTAVMRAWERWALFPTNFVAVWKEVFEKGEQTTTTATQQQPMQI